MLNVTDFLFWIKPCEKEGDSLSGKLGGTVGKGLVAKRQSSRLFVYMHMRKVFFRERPLLRLSSSSQDHARATGPKKELGICVASRDGEKEEEKEEEASFRYFHDEKTSFFF